MSDIREQLKRKLAEADHPTTADQQKAWEQKVASTMAPLIQALEVRPTDAPADCCVCPQCEDVINERGECLCVATGRKVKR